MSSEKYINEAIPITSQSPLLKLQKLSFLDSFLQTYSGKIQVDYLQKKYISIELGIRIRFQFPTL
jgi:hypothetical protein